MTRSQPWMDLLRMKIRDLEQASNFSENEL